MKHKTTLLYMTDDGTKRNHLDAHGVGFFPLPTPFRMLPVSGACKWIAFSETFEDFDALF